MQRTKEGLNIDYFNIEGSPGGNQDWCTDFWMNIGGCGALAACDVAICLAKNWGHAGCCPMAVTEMTKRQYVDFGMVMKPYIHPRMGGVSKLSIFTEGFEKYLRDRGYEAAFEVCPGDEPYEEALAFARRTLERNLPIPFLLLRHRNPLFKDLNWHWFMVTGYALRDHRVMLRYHTYGEVQEVDFQALWNTGMYRRGGMIAVEKVKRL